VGDGFGSLVFRPLLFPVKIKQAADDFRVEELTDFVPSAGAFALYQLHKTGWTTHDALNTVRRLWQVRRSDCPSAD